MERPRAGSIPHSKVLHMPFSENNVNKILSEQYEEQIASHSTAK